MQELCSLLGHVVVVVVVVVVFAVAAAAAAADQLIKQGSSNLCRNFAVFWDMLL